MANRRRFSSDEWAVSGCGLAPNLDTNLWHFPPFKTTLNITLFQYRNYDSKSDVLAFRQLESTHAHYKHSRLIATSYSTFTHGEHLNTNDPFPLCKNRWLSTSSLCFHRVSTGSSCSKLVLLAPTCCWARGSTSSDHAISGSGNHAIITNVRHFWNRSQYIL